MSVFIHVHAKAIVVYTEFCLEIIERCNGISIKLAPTVYSLMIFFFKHRNVIYHKLTISPPQINTHFGVKVNTVLDLWAQITT